MKYQGSKSSITIKFIAFLFPALILTFQGCMNGGSGGEEAEKEEKSEYQPFQVVTTAMEFQSADTISSGWQTIEYHNESYENHFILLDKYPEGKTIENGMEEVVTVFQDGMDLINEGKYKAADAEFAKLPEWFSQVVYTGGTGLISPGKTAVTTVNLEPGYYVMECYVKMQNGMFHTTMGMAKELIITEDTTDHSPPEPDVKISISGERGIKFDKAASVGKQVFSVYFADQTVHENFLGHDVHLVKLEEGASLEELEMWMNWAHPEGLRTPAPENITFLGGINDMPAGTTGYFEADLEPGEYAFISEVPNTIEKGMLQTFTVEK